ncbi:LysR family transcriptional regulator [Conexibacter woesei]|uniref:LysR family transcriptional regulator n=1 Tax=Conexibacter woesei TaxID=191495 RepID=UPI00054F4793|nr:LysR family transcriptional regulator [Conexibacter woesei]
MPLDVKRLRVLRELAERGTVAATAAALSFTPSAVSQQLSALEREAGVVLLEREGRRLALTDAGRVLVAHADTVLAQLERAEADLHAASTEVSGTLNVAAFSSFARSLLPQAAAAMLRHQHLQLHVRDAEPQDSIPLLRLGELDVVIAQRFPYVPRDFGPAFHVVELFDDALHLATGPGHHDAPARFGALADRPWVAGHPGTSCHEVVIHACHAAGHEPRIVGFSNDFAVVAALVAQGVGLALIPEIAHDQAPPEVTLRPLDPPLSRQVLAVVRAGAEERPAVAAFLAELRAVAAGRPD